MIEFIKYYLVLKLKILSRYTREVGYLALVFYPLVLIFIFRSVYVLSLQPYGYLYLDLLIFIVLQSIHHSRKDLFFVKSQIQNWPFMLFIEYLFWLSPLLIFLILIGQFLGSFVLILFVYLAIAELRSRFFTISIPKLKLGRYVPLKESFEWLAGIRKKPYLIFLALILVVASLYNSKAGLLIGSALLVITVATFYARCEAKYWIWLYPLASKTFLIRKIKHFGQLISPYMLLLLLCFLVTKQANWVYLGFPAFILIIVNIILVKYIYSGGFEFGMQLMQTIVLVCGLSIYLNPFMLIIQVIFFFYLFTKARRALKSIL